MEKPKEQLSSHELRMPKMGESISEGTIINWLVAEGDSFEEGETLLEVATDKVDNEIPAPAAGRVIKILHGAKEVIAVGQTIALISLEPTQHSEEKSTPTAKKTPKDLAKKKKKIAAPIQSNQIKANSNTFISPLVLSIAKEHHISFEELARIPATGHEGRLRKSDVFAYLNDGRPFQFTQPTAVDPTAYHIPQLKFDKGTGTVVKMDRMRQMIADHMVYSKHTSPHVTAYVEADLTKLVLWRTQHKEAFQKKYGQKLTFTPLFVEAVAKAIADFPNINASVDGENIIVKQDINIGMATALPSGNLIVPVVKNADTKNLKTLATDVNALVQKARNNALTGDDIKGSTFTISNVGTFGSVMGTPIINQPEVAILAFGIIKKRAEVLTTEKGDEIAIRSMMYLSLSFDHRVVDGFLGGSFVKRVADYLEKFDPKRTI